MSGGFALGSRSLVCSNIEMIMELYVVSILLEGRQMPLGDSRNRQKHKQKERHRNVVLFCIA